MAIFRAKIANLNIIGSSHNWVAGLDQIFFNVAKLSCKRLPYPAPFRFKNLKLTIFRAKTAILKPKWL